MDISSTYILEKVCKVPYLSSPATKNFLFILEGDCFLKKKEIELSVKNASPNRAATVVITVGMGASSLTAITGAVLTFAVGFSWLIGALVVISALAIIMLNVKNEKAKDVYDFHFRKNSWFTFYENNFKKVHASYLLPLYENSCGFKELSKVLVNEKELETLLVVAKSFEGTFEELLETAKALEVP